MFHAGLKGSDGMAERTSAPGEGGSVERAERIVLAICTAGRPEGLRRLLETLCGAAPEGLDAVVVVDNDPRRDGLGVCDEIAAVCPWPLAPFFEPVRGVSSARNRAVREALALGADAIAMIDDDEWPSPAWLGELVRVRRETGAQVVGGPVVPVPSKAVPNWDRIVPHHGILRDLPDGASCLLYGAGNFMADRRCFEGGDPFDPAFDRIGGEDLHFFLRLARQGASMRWAAKAVVYEDTPDERLTEEWLLARQMRRGIVNIRVQRRLDATWGAEALRLARSGAALARAGIWRLAAAGRGASAQLEARIHWAYALGRIEGHRPGEKQLAFGHGGPPGGQA